MKIMIAATKSVLSILQLFCGVFAIGAAFGAAAYCGITLVHSIIQ